MRSDEIPGPTPAEIDEAYREDRARIRGLCIGHCNRRFIDKGAGTPNYGEPVLCHKCIKELSGALVEIDGEAAIAAAAADGMRGSTGQDDSAVRLHRGASELPSPSPVFDDLDEMASCLFRWMRLKRPRAARLGLLAREITESASWIGFNLPSFTDDREIAAQFQQEITGWHRRLMNRAKAGTALFSKPLPCPRCRLIALQQERGSEVVKCSECGRIMSTREYDDMAAEADQATAAGAEPKPAARGRKAGAAA
jgi:hypothetical protein